ncbi:MAG TPA: AraC family transcriptional regulator ligand-binding domain-containing protein [Polyangiaceae bacterium]|nr:AraC family transcriptional regulator ligand-binding domain-containing protein [Polyangiaceae bacterium]
MGLSSVSGRFIQPFARVLSEYECFATESLNKLKAMDPGSRLPVRQVNELATSQVRETGDPDLGLKAAEAMPLGGGGALDYAMHTASSIREASEVGARHSPLFNDALGVQIDVRGPSAILRVDIAPPVPRAVTDFTLAVWYRNYLRAPLADAPKLECWFSHSRPSNTNEYERTFGTAGLRFGAPFSGFAFAREWLDAPLPGSDPALHALLCEHVALMLEQLPQRRTVAARVREIALRDLLRGSPNVVTVARQLRMSARTLGRRLQTEGTSFTALLDDLRRELALRHVGGNHAELSEIAFRLGFAHVEAFHRAFRRWTGETPLGYRRKLGLVRDSQAGVSSELSLRSSVRTTGATS